MKDEGKGGCFEFVQYTKMFAYFSLLESFSCPGRISSAVQHGVYSYLIVLQTIIDGEGKPL